MQHALRHAAHDPVVAAFVADALTCDHDEIELLFACVPYDHIGRRSLQNLSIQHFPPMRSDGRRGFLKSLLGARADTIRNRAADLVTDVDAAEIAKLDRDDGNDFGLVHRRHLAGDSGGFFRMA